MFAISPSIKSLLIFIYFLIFVTLNEDYWLIDRLLKIHVKNRRFYG